MYEIKRHNRQAGKFYFSEDTMRFFGSRTSEDVFEGPGGVFFITSEKNGSEPRRYTVRKYDPKTGDCDTAEPDGFQAYASLNGAKARAKKLAESAPETLSA